MSKPTLAKMATKHGDSGKGGSRYPKGKSQKVFDENIWESQTSKRRINKNLSDINEKQKDE